jgi:hypothetical protein
MIVCDTTLGHIQSGVRVCIVLRFSTPHMRPQCADSRENRGQKHLKIHAKYEVVGFWKIGHLIWESAHGISDAHFNVEIPLPSRIGVFRRVSSSSSHFREDFQIRTGLRKWPSQVLNPSLSKASLEFYHQTNCAGQSSHILGKMPKQWEFHYGISRNMSKYDATLDLFRYLEGPE